MGMVAGGRGWGGGSELYILFFPCGTHTVPLSRVNDRKLPSK